MEITQSEEHKNFGGKKNEESPRNLWNNIKWSNIHIIVVQKGEEKD